MCQAVANILNMLILLWSICLCLISAVLPQKATSSMVPSRPHGQFPEVEDVIRFHILSVRADPCFQDVLQLPQRESTVRIALAWGRPNARGATTEILGMLVLSHSKINTQTWKISAERQPIFDLACHAFDPFEDEQDRSLCSALIEVLSYCRR